MVCKPAMDDRESDGTGGAMYEKCHTCEFAHACYGPDDIDPATDEIIYAEHEFVRSLHYERRC